MGWAFLLGLVNKTILIPPYWTVVFDRANCSRNSQVTGILPAEPVKGGLNMGGEHG